MKGLTVFPERSLIRMRGQTAVICAWCAKEHRNDLSKLAFRDVTHGICETCKVAVIAEEIHDRRVRPEVFE